MWRRGSHLRPPWRPSPQLNRSRHCWLADVSWLYGSMKTHKSRIDAKCPGFDRSRLCANLIRRQSFDENHLCAVQRTASQRLNRPEETNAVSFKISAKNAVAGYGIAVHPIIPHLNLGDAVRV